MSNSVMQPSFTSGELAPSLYGRVDFARYYTGMKTCRNFIVRQFGGVSNRPGSVYIGDVSDHVVKHRLIPFSFSTDQNYVLVLGNLTMQIIKDGGLVVYPVGHASAGQVVEIVTPWPESVLFDLKYAQNADVITVSHQSYPSQQITRTDHHLWTIAAFVSDDGPFQSINIDSSKTVISSGVSGSVTLTAAVDMFTVGMVGELFYIEQNANSATNVKRWEVEKAILINDIRRAGSNYYQALSSGTTGTVRPTTLEGIESDGDPGVTWSYLHSGIGVVRITAFTDAKHITGMVVKRLPDSVMTGTVGKTITGATGYTTYAHVAIAAHGFMNGDSVTIAGVVGMTEINGTFQIVVVDVNTIKVTVSVTNLYISGGTASKTLTATATYKWAKAAYGAVQGYPACNSYYQQRKVFGGAPGEPQTNRFSKTAGFLDFGVSVPVLDDDAITSEITSAKVNAIEHYVELNSLVVLTSNGPWIASGGTNNVLTPAACSFKKQGVDGSSPVTPIVIGSRALYVQAKGNQVRSLGYTFSNDSFDGTDLTVVANHLFKQKVISDWCYQSIPFSCVWAVRDDGVLLGLTFLPEHEVIGWHRHDTDGLYESTACITEGNEDVVYCIVNRTISGATKRYIERFSARESADIVDSIFVDSALTYDGRQTGTVTITGGTTWNEETVTATSSAAVFVAGDVGNEIHLTDEDNNVYRLRITAFTSSTVVSVFLPSTLPPALRTTAVSWGLAKDVFSGLSHLEGKTVTGLADGMVLDDVVVTSGTVTIPYPGVVVHIGLPYVCDIETLSLNASGSSMLDKFKNIARVRVLCEESVGLMAGPDTNHLELYKQRQLENYDQAIQPTSGLATVNIPSTWDQGGRVVIRQSNPLPLTILAIIPEVNLAS